MPRVLIISDSVLGGRARIEREAAFFEARGWQVIVAGKPNARPVPHTWETINLSTGIHQPLTKWSLFMARAGMRSGADAFWGVPGRDAAFAQLAGAGPDMVVAHNHPSVPFAAQLAETFDIPCVLDLHEYPIGQFHENTLWRLLYAPYVKSYLDYYLPAMRLVTTVSAGIARQVKSDHRLLIEPIVIRSLPPYRAMPMRPSCPHRIEVLYHGVVSRYRGLEMVIDSVPEWRTEFHLTIRGRGNLNYINELRRRSALRGVSERIRFEPEVPRSEVIAAANTHDVGIFITRGTSTQRRYVLPNKLFEYIMAGLAVCVSAMPEMCTIVEKHGVGITVDEAHPSTVARAINSLDAVRIADFKQHSIAAARALSWEAESIRLSEAYAGAGIDLGPAGQ